MSVATPSDFLLEGDEDVLLSRSPRLLDFTWKQLRRLSCFQVKSKKKSDEILYVNSRIALLILVLVVVYSVDDGLNYFLVDC